MKRIIAIFASISILLSMGVVYAVPASAAAGSTLQEDFAIYGDILEYYYEGISSGWPDYGEINKPYGIQEVSMMFVLPYYQINTIDDAGFCFQDLDGDGVDELIISSYRDAGVGEIYNLYTYHNGHTEEIASSGERYPFYLGKNNLIYFWGSSGAGNTVYGEYSFIDGMLQVNRFLWFYEGSWYFSNTINSVWVNYSVGETIEEKLSQMDIISSSEAERMLAKFDENHVPLQLTSFREFIDGDRSNIAIAYYSKKIQEIKQDFSNGTIESDGIYNTTYFSLQDVDFDGIPELYFAVVSTFENYYTALPGSERYYYLSNNSICQATIDAHDCLGLFPYYGQKAYSLSDGRGQFILREKLSGNVFFVTKDCDIGLGTNNFVHYQILTFDKDVGRLSAETLLMDQYNMEERQAQSLVGYDLICGKACFGDITGVECGEWYAPYVDIGNGSPFLDVPSSAYYADAVRWAFENGVTTGTSATTFSPNATCTRGQVVTFLWRAMGQPEPLSTDNTFMDVLSSDYYYKPVLWAVENGIALGTSATKFSPQQTCSTAHILTFLYRAYGVGTDGWYEEAGRWAEQNGLLSGTGAHPTPTEDCPRANVVTFLYRMADSGSISMP